VALPAVRANRQSPACRSVTPGWVARSDDDTEEAGKKVWRMLARAGRADLVISDEVMWALPACRRSMQVPCVLLTDWFFAQFGYPHHDWIMNDATAIVVPDFAVAHPDLSHIVVPVHFTGPLVKTFTVDRAAARKELDLPAEAFVAVVTLGGMPDRPEAQQIVDLAVAAWTGGARPEDRLVVLANRRAGRVAPNGCRWVGITPTPETYFGAADVVLADVPGFTVCELGRNDTAVVAVATTPMNTATERRLEFLASIGLVTNLHMDDGPEELWRLMSGARHRTTSPNGTKAQWANADDVADCLLRYL